ncbi:hypothetical protein DIPPA_08593 [Diplonema papillatum]|nr:hypothetical protein DIPPA_08593 [Diplonema papillatum]
MPVPPSTPQVRIAAAPDFHTGSNTQPRVARRSFMPGSTLVTAESPGMPLSARKSIAPRQSMAPRGVGLPIGPQVVNMTEYSAKVAEANRLKLQLDTANEKLEEERSCRQRKEDEAVNLAKKLNEVESRIGRYQREAGRSERRVKREEDMKIRGEQELKHSIDELQHALGDVQCDKAEMAAKIATLKEKFSATESELIRAKTGQASLQQETDDLHAANEQLEVRHHSLETENSELKIKLSRLEGELEATRATLADERKEAESHLHSLMEKHAREIDDKSDELDSVEAAAKAAQREASAKIAGLNAANEELTVEREKVMRALDEVTVDRDNAKEEVARLAKAGGEMSAEGKKLAKKLLDAEKEADALTHAAIEKDSAAAQRAEQFVRERKDAHSQTERLRRELLATKQQLADVSSTLRLKEDEVAEAERNGAAHLSEIEELTGEVAKLRDSLDRTRSTDAQSMKEVHDRNASLKNSTEVLQDTVRDYKRKLSKAEKENAKLRAEVAAANDRVEQLSNDNDKLEDQCADIDYKLRLEEHNAKKARLISEKLREKLEQRDGEIRSLKTSKKSLVATANERIDRMNEETKRLETVANQYRAEYELLKARLARYRKVRGIESFPIATEEPAVDAPQAADNAGGDGDIREDEVSEDCLGEEKRSSFEEAMHQTQPGVAGFGRRSLPVKRSFTVANVDDEEMKGEDAADDAVSASEHSSSHLVAAVHHAGNMPPTIPAEDELEAMDFKALKTLAKDLGLKLNGGKKEIIARITESSA